MSKPSYRQTATPPIELGDELRRLREDRGLALREIAHATGIDLATVNKLEQGVRLPTQGQCAELARYFGESEAAWEARRLAALFWRNHAGNPAALKAVEILQETAPAYIVNKSENKRGKAS